MGVFRQPATWFLHDSEPFEFPSTLVWDHVSIHSLFDRRAGYLLASEYAKLTNGPDQSRCV